MHGAPVGTGLGGRVGVGAGVGVCVGVGVGVGVFVGVLVGIGVEVGAGVDEGDSALGVAVAVPSSEGTWVTLAGVAVGAPPGFSQSGIPLWAKRMTAKATASNTTLAARIIATLRNWFLATTALAGG